MQGHVTIAASIIRTAADTTATDGIIIGAADTGAMVAGSRSESELPSQRAQQVPTNATAIGGTAIATAIRSEGGMSKAPRLTYETGAFSYPVVFVSSSSAAKLEVRIPAQSNIGRRDGRAGSTEEDA